MKRISVFYLLILATLPLAAQDLLQPAAWDGYYNIACSEKLVDYNADAFYMCRPSFTPEYALSFECDGRYLSERQTPLVFKCAEENLWYNDNYPTVDGKRRKRKNRWDSKYHNVKVSTYELIVSREAKALIYDLITAANETATYFNGELSGFDGVTYYFNSGRKYGRAWSPSKKCRTGRLVTAMDSICRAVELGDTAMLYRQLPACRALLHEFRLDYPIEAFKHDFWYSCSDTSCVEVICVGRYTVHLNFRYNFVNPVPMDSAARWCASMSDGVAQLARQLFLMQDTLRTRLCVQIGNCQTDEYYFGKAGYGIHLVDTTDFVNKCLSAPLQQEGLYRLDGGTWQQIDTTGINPSWEWFGF